MVHNSNNKQLNGCGIINKFSSIVNNYGCGTNSRVKWCWDLDIFQKNVRTAKHFSFCFHMVHTAFYKTSTFTIENKMLSYRRETALQGAL